MTCTLLIGIMMTASLPAPAMAQGAPVEVIVRATRFTAYTGDAVFSQSDLTRDALGRGSLDQTLKRETQASLFRRSSSLTANPTVQSISLRAIGPSGAGRALVTLDGVPQNDPFGNWVIWAALPEDALSHIHVVKGAGGGAYGAGALTGVIDLSLDPPANTTPVLDYANVMWGGRGNSVVTIGAGAPGLSLHYGDRTLNGDTAVRPPQAGAADGPVIGRDQAWLANSAFPLCATSNCATASVLIGHYDSRRDTGLAGATSSARGDQVALSLARQPQPDRLGWRVQVWHRASDLSNTSVSVAAGRTGTTLANNQFKTPSTGDGINAALRRQTTNAEWEIGVDARATQGEEREVYSYVSGAPTRYRVAGGRTLVTGVYGEGSQHVGAWVLTAALRADQWRAFAGHRDETMIATGTSLLSLRPDDQTASEVSARLGAAYAVNAVTTVRIAAYNGFRPPSLNELYRPFRVGNDVTEANAALRPEKLTGIETGLRIGDRERYIDACLFANRLNDPITNVTIGTGPATFPTAGFIPAGGTLRQRQNAGEIRAYGFEGRARYPLTDWLAATGALTMTHARVHGFAALDGKHPAEAPDYSGAAGVEARIGRAIVNADLTFDGQTFDDDLNTLVLKASQRLTLSLDYPLTSQLSASLRIDNVLDAATPISRSGDGTLSYDTHRNLWAGLVFRH